MLQYKIFINAIVSFLGVLSLWFPFCKGTSVYLDLYQPCFECSITQVCLGAMVLKVWSKWSKKEKNIGERYIFIYKIIRGKIYKQTYLGSLDLAHKVDPSMEKWYSLKYSRMERRREREKERNADKGRIDLFMRKQSCNLEEFYFLSEIKDINSVGRKCGLVGRKLSRASCILFSTCYVIRVSWIDCLSSCG